MFTCLFAAFEIRFYRSQYLRNQCNNQKIQSSYIQYYKDKRV